MLWIMDCVSVSLHAKAWSSSHTCQLTIEISGLFLFLLSVTKIYTYRLCTFTCNNTCKHVNQIKNLQDYKAILPELRGHPVHVQCKHMLWIMDCVSVSLHAKAWSSSHTCQLTIEISGLFLCPLSVTKILETNRQGNRKYVTESTEIND